MGGRYGVIARVGQNFLTPLLAPAPVVPKNLSMIIHLSGTPVATILASAAPVQCAASQEGEDTQLEWAMSGHCDALLNER